MSTLGLRRARGSGANTFELCGTWARFLCASRPHSRSWPWPSILPNRRGSRAAGLSSWVVLAGPSVFVLLVLWPGSGPAAAAGPRDAARAFFWSSLCAAMASASVVRQSRWYEALAIPRQPKRLMAIKRKANHHNCAHLVCVNSGVAKTSQHLALAAVRH